MKALLEHVDVRLQIILLRNEWSARCNKPQPDLTALDHIFYLIAVGLYYDNTVEYQLMRLKNSFGHVKSTNKLINGRRRYDTLENLLYSTTWLRKKDSLKVSEELIWFVRDRSKELLEELRKNG